MRLDHLLSKETACTIVHEIPKVRFEGSHFSLFNLEGALDGRAEEIWGFSSAGRAPALQAGGQRFDPANLHQRTSTGTKPSEAGLDRRGGATERSEVFDEAKAVEGNGGSGVCDDAGQ